MIGHLPVVPPVSPFAGMDRPWDMGNVVVCGRLHPGIRTAAAPNQPFNPLSPTHPVKFYEDYPPRTDKPIMIAAMPDMGNVGGIVIDYINRAVKAKVFRKMVTTYPSYVTDREGVISLPNEEWLYRYADGLMTFGGGSGQPRDSSELHAACRDVAEVARRFSARLLYTVGGYHTRAPQDPPSAVVTATTEELAGQLKRSGFASSPRNSVIQGFNGHHAGIRQGRQHTGHRHLRGAGRALHTPVPGRQERHKDPREADVQELWRRIRAGCAGRAPQITPAVPGRLRCSGTP